MSFKGNVYFLSKTVRSADLPHIRSRMEWEISYAISLIEIKKTIQMFKQIGFSHYN